MDLIYSVFEIRVTLFTAYVKIYEVYSIRLVWSSLTLVSSKLFLIKNFFHFHVA